MAAAGSAWIRTPKLLIAGSVALWCSRMRAPGACGWWVVGVGRQRHGKAQPAARRTVVSTQNSVA